MVIENSIFDIIVIGGGISGLGVLSHAAREGYQTLLLERKLCAQATSDKSLRIIHGGFRYLQTFDLFRVLQSIRDQAALLKNYPQFITPLQCVMPLEQTGLKSQLPVKAALMIYGALSYLGAGRIHGGKILSTAEAESEIPILKGFVPHGVLSWGDAKILDPAQLVFEFKREAQQHGGVIGENISVKEVLQIENGYQVIAEENGVERTFFSRAVVNATGPWLETLNVKPRHASKQTWCRAYNIIINTQLEKHYGIGIQGRKRLFFLVPRGNKTVIGTGYARFSGELENISVSDEEVAGFLESFNHALPSARVAFSDIESIEVGVIPIREFREGDPLFYGVSPIINRENYIEIVSTKYTTFQSQARRVLNQIKLSEEDR